MKTIMSKFALGLLSADVWAAKMRGMQRVYNICEVRTIFSPDYQCFQRALKISYLVLRIRVKDRSAE